MWNDRLRFADSVMADWQALSNEDRYLVRNALQRLDDDPILGVPLFDPLRGLWSHRVEHLRIVYRIEAEARFLIILSIAKA